MQNDKIFSEILDSLVRTKEEANLFLSEVEALERSLYKIGEGDFNSTLQKDVRAKTAGVIVQLTGSGDRGLILKTLKAKINTLTYLNLTIAFEPTEDAIGRIHNWVKQNLGEGICLNLTIDKKILGGAVVEYKGKVASFTLLTKVDQYFLNNNVNV